MTDRTQTPVGSSSKTKLSHHSRLHDAIDGLLYLQRHRPPSTLLPAARRLAAGASSLPANTLLANRLIALLASLGAVRDARCVFDSLLSKDICTYNSLVSAYVKSGDAENARKVFDEMPMKDHFSWSSMMSCYVRCGHPRRALALYRNVPEGMIGRRFIVSSALAAAAAVPCLWSGREIHCYVLKGVFHLDTVAWSTLVDMYAKCGRLDVARQVFDRTVEIDVVSWTTMIERYFDSGRVEEGFRLFIDMLRAGKRPNEFTFAGVLRACGESGAEDFGTQIHGCIVKCDCQPSLFAKSALVRMYSKFGDIDKAKDVFDGMMNADIVSWTSMISGLAHNGHPEEAMRYFNMFLRTGVAPDHVIFVGVLHACAHAGLIEDGLTIFHSIKEKYGIEHTADHYACAVDLLSRSGRFEEAEAMINRMSVKPNEFLWASLLGGCRIHKNAKLARRAAEALFQIEPENPATYATLANIYASVGSFGEVENIRKIMEERGLMKQPGSSWTTVQRVTHVFTVGDKLHPRAEEIYVQLRKLDARMRAEGYLPNTDFVLHDVDNEQKEQDIVHHSERLAVAYALISTPENFPIKVFKNLRICGDCHTAFKFIARIVQRVITVRDSTRFHHFKDGVCSCQDYW